MYALYEKISTGEGHRYIFKNEVSLLGCNVGFIPKMLKTVLSKEASEPIDWHLNVSGDLSRTNLSNQALIISLKPYNKNNLSIYELVNVWGVSSNGWTAMMYHIRGLFVDADPKKIDSKDFPRSPREVDDPIFTMAYVMDGTVKNGEIIGKWSPTRPGSSNSVLLWPTTFEYFAKMATEVIRGKGHVD